MHIITLCMTGFNDIPSPHVYLKCEVTSLLLLQIWLLNSDSITASVPETHVGDEGTDGFTDPHGPSLRAARALKLLYTTCSNAGDQQRE